MSLKRHTLTFLILLITFGIQNAYCNGRIVGGENATIDERPYQASLQSNSSEHICGGALVSERWVLTAAHCVRDPELIQSVVLGTENLEVGGTRHTITNTVIHPGYDNGSRENDIALIRIEPMAPSHLVPLSLPDEDVILAAGNDGDVVTVSGWGRLSEAGPDPSVLQQVDLPIVGNQVCADAYESIPSSPQIVDSMLCAGLLEGGVDSCQGDSGGALVASVNGVTYGLGIVSWGQGCARPNFYGVYTRIYSFARWINEIIAEPTFARIQDRYSGNCWHVRGASKKAMAPVQTWGCLEDQHFEFTFIPDSEDYFSVQDRNSGLCLHVLGGSLKQGAPLLTWRCQNSDHFKFRKIAVSEDYFKLQVKHSGMCLHVRSGTENYRAPIITWSCNVPDSMEYFHFRQVP